MKQLVGPLGILAGTIASIATAALALLLWISGPASATHLPDLELSNLTVGSTAWVDGETISFGYTIANIGTVSATNSASGFYLSPDSTFTTTDLLLHEDPTTGDMSPGEVNAEGEPNTFVVDLDALGVTPGTYYVGAIADHTFIISEEDETNNLTLTVDAIEITIDGLPDLVLSDLTVNKTNWTDGDSIVFGYTITNSGSAAAADSDSGLYLSTDVNITATDVLLLQDPGTGTMSVGEVNPEGNPNIFVLDLATFGLGTGTYYLGAIADHRDIIPELDEVNNATTQADAIAIIITDDLPDLVLSDLTVGSTDWTDGASITFGYNVTNLGTAEPANSASGLYLSTNTLITPSDTLLSEDPVTMADLIGAVSAEGQPNQLILDVNALGLVPGTYFLGVIVDHGFVIAESNEANNATTTADAIEITLHDVLPDLVMSDLTVDATHWVDGGTINFTYTITNSGTETADNSLSGLYLSPDTTIGVNDTLLLEDPATGTMPVGLVNPEGDPNNFVLDIDALGVTPGIWYLGAFADHGFVVTESNESNNVTAPGEVIAITVADDICNGLAVTVRFGHGEAPTSGADVILGTPGPDVIDGLGGSDVICGGDGDDTLTGAAGLDIMYGGPGADTIHGGPNADTIYGGAGDDVIHGDEANDVIYGNTDDDQIHGGPGVDRIYGHAGLDIIYGDDGDDRLYGGSDNDIILGGAGADRIWGQAGLDLLDGEGDSDEIFGGIDADQIVGGDANDTIHGQGGDDQIFGDGGADTLYGHTGDDTIDGNEGEDMIFGHGGADILNGGEDNDTIFGGGSADTIHGSFGDDTLNGQGGNDDLFGENGTDTCNGGAGGGDTATTCEITSGIP